MAAGLEFSLSGDLRTARPACDWFCQSHGAVSPLGAFARLPFVAAPILAELRRNAQPARHEARICYLLRLIGARRNAEGASLSAGKSRFDGKIAGIPSKLTRSELNPQTCTVQFHEFGAQFPKVPKWE